MQGMMQEIGDYEDYQSPTRYPQQYSLSQPGTPSTVRSVNREQPDAASANAAVSYQGYLADEQKTSRDRNRTMQGEHLYDMMHRNRPQAMGAMVASDQRQAMPAIINRQSDGRTLTLLAQKGGEETTSSIFAQTESGASALVSEACTQMEQISLSESFRKFYVKCRLAKGSS